MNKEIGGKIMTMLNVFMDVVSELPIDLVLLSTKEQGSKFKLEMEFRDKEDVGRCNIDLYKACAPGMERKYCWEVIATAISAMYLNDKKYEKAQKWFEARKDQSKIISENA